MTAPKDQKPEEGQNPIWPGEGLRKAGEEIKDTDRQETTRIPEIRPDGKKHEENDNVDS